MTYLPYKNSTYFNRFHAFSLLFFFALPYSLSQVQFVHFAGAEIKDTTTVTLTFKIKEGYHIQANEVLESHLIATQLQMQTPEDMSICALEYPKAKRITLGEGRPLRVFGGMVEVVAHIESEQLLQGHCLQGQLQYQTCDKRKCYFPRILDFEFSMH